MICLCDSSTCFEQLCAYPQEDIWYNHCVLVAVWYAGRPLTQSDYTIICIHAFVLLRMNT